MIRSTKPSFVFLPAGVSQETIFAFLCQRFPMISYDTWENRINDGKVHFKNGEPISLSTPYKEKSHIAYYRELPEEEKIPFEAKVLFEDQYIIIADKPHFLPVHPAGKYIRETLVTRLQEKLHLEELNSAHRLDRLTAGLVLLCKNKDARKHYQLLFQEQHVSKVYHCIAAVPSSPQEQWLIQNRLVSTTEPHFLMQSIEGEANAESSIKILEHNESFAKFELKPKSGKKHQLRLHMCEVSNGILNDPWYPVLLDEQEQQGFERPMQLLAKELHFVDPLTGEKRSFISEQDLQVP